MLGSGSRGVKRGARGAHDVAQRLRAAAVAIGGCRHEKTDRGRARRARPRRISQALERHSADRQHRDAYRSGDPRQALEPECVAAGGFDSVGQTVPATM